MNLPEYNLHDVYSDLHQECLKIDVLIRGTENTDDDLQEGVNAHLCDLRERLDTLCDRLQLLDIRATQTKGGHNE